ncbi:hypothetical protein J5S49_01705 [Virgibacillus halodenitrificans]|uniref:ArnT family glycosyltransferase n=1 Tax=Virgibacillus halodenitrificans TaxID=1482 RepID=UPI001F18149F|nr:hypothetical protein [Virgibacillus halodenitrificans]MCG1027004.1 hypothetical protein [Virgibacillus halodenitrificans]
MRKLFSPVNVGLLVLFFLYSFGILIRSAFDPNGYVTSDSAHYLQLAQNLLNRDGLSTANYVDGMSTYFATWPIGYPLLIAAASAVTGLSVFWASKLVNILCLAFCFWLVKRLFAERAIPFALIFSIATFSDMFVYTWSEVPFLLGMLWLVFGLYRYITTLKYRYIGHLFAASLFMYFMRYIGLIGAGIIGLLGFYFLFKKQWKPMIACWLSGSISILLACIYLVVNFIQTGQFTGMERIPRIETPSEFWTMLREAIVMEGNIFSSVEHVSFLWTIIVVLLALIVFLRPKRLFQLFQTERQRLVLPGLFLAVGIIYLIGIVYMRWTAYFDTFNFRLLGPATFMVAFSLCSWIAMTDKRTWLPWRRVPMFVFTATFIVNVLYPVYTSIKTEEQTYKETIDEVKSDYEAIPQHSIVAFENIHARYLRLDIQFIKVHFRPYFAEAESIEAFHERITPNNTAGIYLQVKSLRGYHYGKGFEKMMEQGLEEGKTFLSLWEEEMALYPNRNSWKEGSTLPLTH